MRWIEVSIILFCPLIGAGFLRAMDTIDSVPQEMVKLGEIYQNRKHYTLAVRVYMRVLEKYPNTFLVPQIKSKLAECYETMENYEEALELYKQIEQAYPESREACLALLREATILNKLGKYDEALKKLDQFLLRYPTHKDIPRVLLIKGKTFQYKRDWGKAEEVYKALLREFPGTPFSEEALTELEKMWKNEALKKYIYQEKQTLKKWVWIYYLYAAYLLYKNREYL